MASLIALAHGSRDPRSARSVSALVDVVRALRPGLDVRLAFLDLSAPRLADVLAGLRGSAVVVPLLLGRAYHARVDVPAAVREAQARSPHLRVCIADVLGAGSSGLDPRLAGAALSRLAVAVGGSSAAPSHHPPMITGIVERGCSDAISVDNPGDHARPGRWLARSQRPAGLDDPSLGVILGAAGSSDAAANAAVAAVADGWARHAPWAGARVAFAAASPDVAEAVAALRARGATRIAVASWFLAPGVLPDRLARAARAADPGVLLAEPLGAHPHVAQVVLDRYDAALDTVSQRPALAAAGNAS
jgi:sirohydrochlorin ferrochelatase